MEVIKGSVFRLNGLKNKTDDSEFVILVIRVEYKPGEHKWYDCALPSDTKDHFKIGDLVMAKGWASINTYSAIPNSYRLRTDIRIIEKITQEQLTDPNYPPPEYSGPLIPEDHMKFESGYYFVENCGPNGAILYFNEAGYAKPHPDYPSQPFQAPPVVKKTNFKGKYLEEENHEGRMVRAQNKKLEALIEKSKQILKEDDEIPF